MLMISDTPLVNPSASPKSFLPTISATNGATKPLE